MSSINKWIGVGRLGRDGELRSTLGGAAVLSFSLACSESWTDKNSGEKKERVEWVRCVYWGKSAEAVGNHLTKGRQVYVEGRLQTRTWQDKNGSDRSTTEVRVDRLVLLGSKSESRITRESRDDREGMAVSSQAAALSSGGVTSDDDDEIPF